jgi:hypothetical protein
MLKSVGETTMQERYRIFRRAGGNFYVRDKITGKAESLETADRKVAKQLVAARNQAVAQPQLNRTMARAYLSAKSPELITRTWSDVMEHYPTVTKFAVTLCACSVSMWVCQIQT